MNVNLNNGLLVAIIEYDNDENKFIVRMVDNSLNDDIMELLDGKRFNNQINAVDYVLECYGY